MLNPEIFKNLTRLLFTHGVYQRVRFRTQQLESVVNCATLCCCNILSLQDGDGNCCTEGDVTMSPCTLYQKSWEILHRA